MACGISHCIGRMVGMALLVLMPAGVAWSDVPAGQLVVVPPKPATGLPAFLRPGVRITYQAGSSVVQGVGLRLIPDDKSNDVVDQNGKRYRMEDLKNSGGIGYLQINIVAVNPGFVAADARNYLITDLQNNVCTSTDNVALVGDGNALGMYWINPARLADPGQYASLGSKVTRVTYNLNGQSYNALSCQSGGAGGYSSRIYDLNTGLLLSESSSNTGGNITTLGKDDTITQGGGSTYISHSRFVSVRQVNIPWANEPTPQWVTVGRQLHYQGAYAAILPTGALPGLGVTVSFAVDRVTNGCAQARMLTRTDIGSGLPPQETMAQRCYGSAMLSGLWVGPQALRRMQPNQTIDQDPITRFSLVFAGFQGQAAVILEQGPTEMTQAFYDGNSGMLTAMRASRRKVTGEIQTQIQLVSQQ